MSTPFQTFHRWRVGWAGLLGCLWLARGEACAEEFRLESAGGRVGIPVSPTAAGFKEVDGFVNCRLPWRWELGKDWHVQTRLDGSLGWLANARVNAVIATVGPTLVLRWRQFPVTLEGGVSPTYISEDDFATKKLGFPFQFTSHAGANWDFAPHFRVSYRFQHMSNAGLSRDNPGLNLHVFGLSYVF